MLDPSAHRSAPATLDADVIVVGAGFSGIGMGVALKKARLDSFVVLERAGDVGGTWRENDYPGCACDIPSMLYSFSFERNDAWSRTFPPQQEIWDYLRRTSIKYGVHSHIRFNTELLDARYDEATATWLVRTTAGLLRSRVLVAGMGPLDKPNVPQLPGLERFTGATFHSSRWDHAFDLAGKDVAVIGTGASAIQFVPQIAPCVRTLSVFQRTAPWVVPKPDGPVTDGQRRLQRFAPYTWAVRTFIYWFLEARAYGFTVAPKQLARFESVAAHHREKYVADPALRERLTPDYRMGCKRILISNDYYPALQRANVELVTARIQEVRARSIVTDDGAEYPADAMIFATGFKATDAVAPVKLYGIGGLELSAAWAGGAEAFLGMSVAGFPNLFLMIGPNTGLGHNSMIFMIESQIRYVMSALAYMRRSGTDALDVRADVQSTYNAALQRRMKRTIWTTGCRSWYLDQNGKNTTLWPGFTFAYRFLTRRLRPERYRSLRAGAASVVPASGTTPAAT